MDEIKANHELDARGLLCPEPVMMLHNKIRDIDEGDVLRILATDPSTQRDIPKFCHFLGHDLLVQQASDNMYTFLVRKCKS